MPTHSSLRNPPSNLIRGEWKPIPGALLQSRNPARPAELVWSAAPRIQAVDEAIAAARDAANTWAAIGLDGRAKVLRKFQSLAAARVEALAALIRDEVGKPMWDARAEAQLLATKVDITLDTATEGTLKRVTGYELSLGGTKSGRCWFRPHGVMAVLGPFNFPAHLPNGHIIPALAMGNTIIFKPSDRTPAVGQFLAQLYHEALEAEGAPKGVVNLVQGGADVAAKLASHDDIDGVLFTGSWIVGRRIMQANLDRPGRMLALEMGGNNPAAILPDADIKQAITECIRCAFITSGQRCTCTRRLIVHEAVADTVIPAICKAAAALTIGDPASPAPIFMGPVISEQARAAIFEAYRAMLAAGGEVLVEMRESDGGTGGWYLTPGVVKVTRFTKADDIRADAGADHEVFGPLLRICIVKTLDEAIEQANATRFGLAASVFTKDAAAAARFCNQVRAGCINWNTGTAGASSKLPFGGLGHSGNHRPAGAFSVDYCAYPVAGMIEKSDACIVSPGMEP